MSNKAILLVNLGSPDSTDVKDVRKYLAQFLMDGKVLDSPALIRWLVVYGLILPKRPAESAEAYEAIWTEDGSPLIVTSKQVQRLLQESVGESYHVELAMRYQNPSIEDAIANLKRLGKTDVILLPLFPHYAMSSYESAVDRVHEVIAKTAPEIQCRTVPPYFDQPDYINALAHVTAPYLEKDHDHLLFSFHGIPERHLRKSDPGNHCLSCENCCDGEHPAHATCYRAQCFKTVAALAERLDLDPDRYSVSFQSRLGRDPWLKPYTDFVINDFPEKGVKKLLVICPAFVSDCLETLEEIGIRAQEDFQEHGGEELTLIPCLNEDLQWIAAIEKLLETAS